MKKIIKTEKAPEAIGPYSQAIVAGDFVFTAGQIALVPETGKVVDGGVREQTRQALENLQAILEASGSNIASVVKTTVYLTRPDHFAPMNEVYAEYFNAQPPARTTVFISALPKDALVEIDAVAQR
ncbi:MAG: RidA family protein [candidate division WOR-3 bacterium]|nr:MAG: RidA family protein [candidate division WOR-3 bacterium]